MDDQSPYKDLSWELMVSALRDELTPEEDAQFRQWLALSDSNRAIYERLQQLWKDGMTDYPYYRQANEGGGWEALRERMIAGEEGKNEVKQEKGSVAEMNVRGGRNSRGRVMMKWVAAAAVVLLLAGAEWWYISQRGEQYETAAGEQKQVALPDGSTVLLQGRTRIRIERAFNKSERKLVLVDGRATFRVVHDMDRPFVVDVGDVSVKDIGTSFIIDRAMDSVKVVVSEGKVAFIERQTGMTKEIGAGGEGVFYTAVRQFGKVSGGDTGLRFDDAPLSEVTAALERKWGKRIVLSDTVMAGRKLTVHLDQESLEDAIKTICASLSLESTIVNGNYVLREAAE